MTSRSLLRLEEQLIVDQLGPGMVDGHLSVEVAAHEGAAHGDPAWADVVVLPK